MSVAFLFPGQCSQSVSMGQDLYDQDELYRNTIEEASNALGYNLWDIIVENTDDKLNQTQFTQPALLATSIALYRCYLSKGGERPTVLSGHSLGEYSALVASGALSFVDGLKLVSARGQFMQSAVPVGEGAMAAVLGLSLDDIRAVCSTSEGLVEAANINAPGQIVIAGSKSAVVNILPLMKDAGAKRAIELPVSVPSHCELMKPAAKELALMLEGVNLSEPEIDVVHNVTAAPSGSVDDIKKLLIEQLYSPVRWVDCVEKLKDYGVDSLVECGPGKVLSGLVKRIDRSLSCSSLNSVGSMSELVN